MGKNDEPKEPLSKWTPELIIQGIKELVTALLGLIILVFTLTIAVRTFGYINDANAIKEAKDILMLLLGLAGVVVGYYFGRIPADARAADAQEKAEDAIALTGEVATRAQLLESEVGQMIEKVNQTGDQMRGSGEQMSVESVAGELSKIRNGLRELTSSCRKRK